MGNVKIVWNEKMIEVFNSLWMSLEFWRTLGLVLLGIMVLLLVFKDAFKKKILQEDANKHDKEAFRLFDLIMTEAKLNGVLELLETKHFYNRKSSDYVDKFHNALMEESRQYINTKIKKASVAVASELKKLRKFIDDNFVAFPNGTQQAAENHDMYPNPEIDGGGNTQVKDKNKFTEFDEDLKVLVASVRSKYQKYRSLIKQILHV